MNCGNLQEHWGATEVAERRFNPQVGLWLGNKTDFTDTLARWTQVGQFSRQISLLFDEKNQRGNSRSGPLFASVYLKCDSLYPVFLFQWAPPPSPTSIFFFKEKPQQKCTFSLGGWFSFVSIRFMWLSLKSQRSPRCLCWSQHHSGFQRLIFTFYASFSSTLTFLLSPHGQTTGALILQYLKCDWTLFILRAHTFREMAKCLVFSGSDNRPTVLLSSFLTDSSVAGTVDLSLSHFGDLIRSLAGNRGRPVELWAAVDMPQQFRLRDLPVWR